MKKLLILIIIGAMLLAAGCTPQEPAATTVPTEATQPTQAPTEETEPTLPTEPVLPADLEIVTFEDAKSAAEAVQQENLTAYGVSMAELSLIRQNTDSGKGLKVMLGDAGRWCQGLRFNGLGAALAQGNERQYVRFYLRNPNSSTISVMFMLTLDGGNYLPFDATKAILTRCDGENVQYTTNNASGYGPDSSVVIPAGFDGWVSWRVSDAPADIATAIGCKLDCRPAAPESAEFYIIDELVFSDAVSGILREYDDEIGKSEEERYMQLKEELVEKISSYLNVTPAVQYYPDFDPVGKSNIKALTYEGAAMGDLKTKVFAYIGYPEGAKAGDQLPAIVLVHGGGGHAFADWIAQWNKRGYVAIAMDNTGFFPNDAYATADGSTWTFGLSANPAFYEEGYGNVMQTDHFATSGKPVEEQWMYHAVVQAILARNLLAADPTVDADKIGIMGISWGSIITSQTIGCAKFAFAVPQYCAGYLNDAYTYAGEYSKNYPAYDYLWKAEDRWDNVDFPVLFLQWVGDYTSTPNAGSKCYLHLKDTGGEYSLIQNWYHGHDWSKEVAYYFADCAIAGKQALTKAVDEPDGRNFSFQISIPEGVGVTARICYMTEDLVYRPAQGSDPNKWYFDSNVTVNGNTVSGTVPADAVSYYIEFTNTVDGKVYYSATSLVYLQ